MLCYLEYKMLFFFKSIILYLLTAFKVPVLYVTMCTGLIFCGDSEKSVGLHLQRH